MNKETEFNIRKDSDSYKVIEANEKSEKTRGDTGMGINTDTNNTDTSQVTIIDSFTPEKWEHMNKMIEHLLKNGIYEALVRLQGE